MATTVRVRRISNPRHRPRKLSAKQIKFFGSKRQKAAIRAKRHRPRTAPVARKTRKRSSNPALVVTLGSMVNPKRRANKVPAIKRNRRRRRNVVHHRRRRRANPVARRRHRRRSNPVAAAPRRRRRYSVRHVARRRSRRNPKVVVIRRYNKRRNARRMNSRRRRNPISTTLFGAPLFGRKGLEYIGGGFAGLLAAKFLPTMVPTSITGGIASSGVGRVVLSGISAVVAGWLGSKVSTEVGQGMLFGGMIQTASVALNYFLPQGYGAVSQYATLGDLTPGAFPVPMNPILAGRPMATLPPAAAMIANGGGGQVRMGVSGLGRAYPAAY